MGRGGGGGVGLLSIVASATSFTVSVPIQYIVAKSMNPMGIERCKPSSCYSYSISWLMRKVTDGKFSGMTHMRMYTSDRPTLKRYDGPIFGSAAKMQSISYCRDHMVVWTLHNRKSAIFCIYHKYTRPLSFFVLTWGAQWGAWMCRNLLSIDSRLNRIDPSTNILLPNPERGYRTKFEILLEKVFPNSIE